MARAEVRRTQAAALCTSGSLPVLPPGSTPSLPVLPPGSSCAPSCLPSSGSCSLPSLAFLPSCLPLPLPSRRRSVSSASLQHPLGLVRVTLRGPAGRVALWGDWGTGPCGVPTAPVCWSLKGTTQVVDCRGVLHQYPTPAGNLRVLQNQPDPNGMSKGRIAPAFWQRPG